MGTQANLLVGVEGDAHLAVLDFGMLAQVHHRCDDFGNACLVVSAEQGGAVGDDQVLAYVVEQFGEDAGLHHDACCLVEDDVLAVVFLDDAWLHVLAAGIGSRVHVGDEADGGHLLAFEVGGKGGIEITVGVKHHILEAQFHELVAQLLGENHLSGCAWGHTARFVTRREYLHVFDESFNKFFHAITRIFDDYMFFYTNYHQFTIIRVR